MAGRPGPPTRSRSADGPRSVRRAEILGVIGLNGAEQTTLFNAISGEVTPDKGEILLDGTLIPDRGPVAGSKAGIARTFRVVRSFESPRLEQITIRLNHPIV